MPWNCSHKELYQLRGEIAVVILDVETDDFFVPHIVAILARHLKPVHRLHNKNDVGPIDNVDAQWIHCIIIGAGGSCFDARPFRKRDLCRRASEVILATDEKCMDHIGILL